MKRLLLISVGITSVIAAMGGIFLAGRLLFSAPTPLVEEPGVQTKDIKLPTSDNRPITIDREVIKSVNPEAPLEIIVENLIVPWEMAWLPDGTMLVTEREGNLILHGATPTTIPISGVTENAESGLLGMALHPTFEQNQLMYLYLTSEVGNGLINRVERYRLQNGQLTSRKVIIDSIPGAKYHDGGRIAFGPDGMLYITTGDATKPEQAQDLASLAGKILRLTPEGDIPADNPFAKSPVYSYGHRNPQGIAWDAEGNLWSTEHGRSGLQSGLDELNLIIAGSNYGWPASEGDTVQSNTVGPVVHSGSKSTWAPASAAYLNGSIFFGGLRGQALYEFKINDRRLLTHFYQEFGRIRTVRVGPDGLLYLTTSNQDGRGTPQTGDDKIIRLDPKVLEN